MKSFALCLARLCVAAWVGAAVLFVIVAVREATFPSFTSEVKDHLAVLRFPAYYATGAALLGVAWLCTLAAIGHPQLPRRRGWIAAGLLTLVLVELAADYQWIYRPLAALVTPAGQPRTSEFVALHNWSTRVNLANVVLSLVAAGVLCWPGGARLSGSPLPHSDVGES
jgi:hypothetical protein